MVGVKAPLWLLAVAGCVLTAHAGGNDCYSYYDHAAKYALDHVAASYPWDEVKQAMSQNQQLSQVMAQGTAVPSSRPPDGHYYTPVSVVCPSQRFMLKAFKVDGKQCYVVRPEVQQVRYARCSEQNRECHYCSYNKGGVSKCEEDYEWQKVWAYCKHIALPKPKPQPRPYPQPRPTLGVWTRPKPQPPTHNWPHPQPYPRPQPYPYPQPRAQVKPTSQLRPAKVWAKPSYYNPYYPRYKRSLSVAGKLEQITLYLPYQCSCKNFRC